ncbi:MAG: OmpA family protein [Myxococcota bacterium]
MNLKWNLLGSAALVLVTACGVDTDVHEKAIADLAACQAAKETCDADLVTMRNTAESLNDDLNKLQGTNNELQEVAEARSTELASVKTNLEASQEELEVLRKQRAAAEKRLQAYRDLKDSLKALVDTGKLSVNFRNGQMVVELPSGILFPSGRSNLSRDGKTALEEVTDILIQFKDRRFLIAGHTDDQAIRTQRFPNNWHLSTARAVSILEFFVDQGFVPQNLAAAGYGEFSPVAPNDTKENRALNRRIEIILVPDLSELPNLTEGQG